MVIDEEMVKNNCGIAEGRLGCDPPEPRFALTFRPIEFIDIPDKVRYLCEDSYIVNLERSEIRCLDCEARSHYSALQQPSEDLFEQIKQLREVVSWILDNTDWPVSE